MKNPPTTASSITPRRGEVWWAMKIPNIPRDRHVPRPVVIVSPTRRNKYLNSIVVVPLSHELTSILPQLHIVIPSGHGGVSKDSYARCDFVTTLDKRFLDNERGPLGEHLANNLMASIVKGIRVTVGDSLF
jgi:mRNA-degrading endonuclease toxin of MazEF toxin-antitoxin module